MGNYNLKHFDGAINIPLSEEWAAGLALLQDTRDGYLSCGAADSNRFSTRVKVLFNASDKLTFLATYDYNWENDHGNNTVPITDWFQVTGGIRHSTDSNSTDYRYGRCAAGGYFDSGWLHYEQDVKSTTYKAGIEFDPGESSMVYAQIATGFKQGGMNMTVPSPVYVPEELVAYEFGSKNRFINGRMQLNLEGYYYQYTNMQAQMPEPHYTFSETFSY